MRTPFGTLRVESPRWWHCGCVPRVARTFSPLAAILPQRITPELSYLQARFAALVSYGLSADLLGEIRGAGKEAARGRNPRYITWSAHHSRSALIPLIMPDAEKRSVLSPAGTAALAAHDAVLTDTQ